MNRLLTVSPTGPEDLVGDARALHAVAAALDGTGPALALVGPDPAPGSPSSEDREVDADVAVTVRTSGSTGEPREVLLPAAALLASARATHARLGGPGRWVLTLPPAHVAGLQVVVRALDAGAAPLVATAGGRFDPAHLARVVRRAGDGPLYTSLVPTQLHRALQAGPAVVDALGRLDAVLVGGAACPPALVAAARDAGLRPVLTYGMTETCGGCVYDGHPLDGVEVRAHEAGLLVTGPVLAAGYLGRPDLDAQAFVEVDGRRWFRTRDHGHVADGRVTVLGRVDDVLVTGGVNVSPVAVEAALASVPGVAEVCVVGVPDPEWGQAVTAVVVPQRGAAGPTLDELRAAARTLGAAAAPRRLVLVDALPVRGPGKVDRVAAQHLAARPPTTSRTEHHGNPG